MVFPLKQHTKISKTKNWQDIKQIVDEKEKEKLLGRISDGYNYAVLCGTNNLAVLDVEDKELFIKWIGGESALNELCAKTLCVNTPHGGIHVYLRAKDLPPHKFNPVFQTKDGKPVADLQSFRSYVVGPGSTINHQHCKSDKCQWKGQNKIDVYTPNGVTKIGEIESLKGFLKHLEDRGKPLGISLSPYAREWVYGTKAPDRDDIDAEKIRKLGDSELIEIKELIGGAWKEGERQNFALVLSGWFAKAKIHPLSTVKLIELITDKTNDPELGGRISAVYYTYRKAGGYENELKELDQYVEELQKSGKVRSVSKGENIDVSGIKGVSGVQEILEREYGEEKAIEIIKKISDIIGVASPYRDSITIITDFDVGLGYTNDMRRLRIYRCKQDKDGGIKMAKLVWEGAITELNEIENSSDGPNEDGPIEYEIKWERQQMNKPLIVRGTVDDIFENLSRGSFLINSRLGKDALNSIINAFINKKRAGKTKNVDAPGFYFINNQWVNVGYEVNEVSVDELKEALLLLNELAEKWYPNVIDKFATTIKWGLIAPFTYARKVKDRKYKVPYLAMYGTRNTGKTTLAEIATVHLWGLHNMGINFVSGGAEADTVARLGEKFRQTTFPLVINEVNKMFENSGIIAMLKDSVEDITARAIVRKNRLVTIPALAPLILTLNPSPPVDFQGMLLVPKTLFLMEYREGERLPNDRMDQFSNDVEPRLRILKAIGQYVAKLVLEGKIDMFTEKWQNLADNLLEKLYRDAGMEPPQWSKSWYRVKTFEDIKEDRKGRIRTLWVDYVVDTYSRTVHKISEVTPAGNEIPVEPDFVTFEMMFDTLIRTNRMPFVRPTKHGGLIITRDIIDELKLDVTNLDDVADILEWTYNKGYSWRSGGKVFNRPVIVTTRKQVIDFLLDKED